MKVAMIYFSGTGNTWYVANQLQYLLEGKGAEVSCLSIEAPSMKDSEEVKRLIDQSDKVLIGYPLYGSVAPKLMVEFINGLPEMVCPKSINVFTTVALYSGDGPIVYKNLLESKGYVYHSGKEFIMNNNFNVPGFPDVLKVGDVEKIQRRHVKVQSKIVTFAERIMTNKHKVQGKTFYDKALGNLQRAHIEAYIEKVNESLSVDEGKCIHCNKCLKICPQNNISLVEGKITFGSDCMACMRCYHLCPKDAINITEESKDLEQWPRFRGVYRDFEKQL